MSAMIKIKIETRIFSVNCQANRALHLITTTNYWRVLLPT